MISFDCAYSSIAWNTVNQYLSGKKCFFLSVSFSVLKSLPYDKSEFKKPKKKLSENLPNTKNTQQKFKTLIVCIKNGCYRCLLVPSIQNGFNCADCDFWYDNEISHFLCSSKLKLIHRKFRELIMNSFDYCSSFIDKCDFCAAIS